MEKMERALAEINEYNKGISDGRQRHSMEEFKKILSRNGCKEEADQLERGYNGEGRKI